MYGKLQGAIDYIGNNFVILMAGNIGFKILLPANVLAAQTVGKNAVFWIETIVREDAITLVGFANISEQEMFQKLTTVSGIGPKVALAILGSFKIGSLESAISTGDVKTLTSVPGVGKKVAERILIELKGKVTCVLTEGFETDITGDTLSALESLGYRRLDCVELVQKLQATEDSVQSLLTKVLKEYAKKQ